MHILITGASSDVTKVLAQELLKQEHTVTLTCSSENSLQENSIFWEKEISNKKLSLIKFSLQHPEINKQNIISLNCDAVVLNAWSKVEKLEIFHTIENQVIEDQFNINVKGNCELLKYLIPGMVERNLGRILFISTLATVSGTSLYAPYSMGKAAIEALIKNIAVDYGKYNISANTLRPGILKTERTRRFWERDFYQKMVSSSIPLLKMGEPIHVAKACLPFLDIETYLTGTELNVSGGLPLFNSKSMAKKGKKSES